MSSYKLLVRLFKEQCISEDKSDNDGDTIITAKPNKDVPSDSLQNPSDSDAGYSGHKGKGYQAQVRETYSTNPDKKNCHSLFMSKLNLPTKVTAMLCCWLSLIQKNGVSLQKNSWPTPYMVETIISSKPS